jgi:N-acylethanolamine-hydrolysing acid amidase
MLTLVFLPLLAASEASEGTAPADETCLLQTEVSPHIQRQGQSKNRPVPEFEINLDLPPEDRFQEVGEHFHDQAQAFYQKVMSSPGALAIAKKITKLRGEETPELMGEIRGLAKASEIPEYVVHATQLGPSLMSLKGPFLDFVHESGISMPKDVSLSSETARIDSDYLSHFEAPSFGNTGIIARDEKDGSVWHVRNFGYALPQFLQKLTYEAHFTKNGKEVFSGQMVFPMTHMFTAVRKGQNGYSYQVNTRYTKSLADTPMIMKNLYQEKRELSGWKARKVLENTDNYEDAVRFFTETPYPSPEYTIISGVKKGTILAREPDTLAYKMDLGKSRYIVATNFDYTKDDKREWLQPTAEEGVSPRVRALCRTFYTL